MPVPGLRYVRERLRRPKAPVHQYAEITWGDVPLLEQLVTRLGGDSSEFRDIITHGDPETVEMYVPSGRGKIVIEVEESTVTMDIDHLRVLMGGPR